MKKSFVAIIAVMLAVVGFMAATPTAKRITGITTTQGANTYLQVGYNELTCNGWVHYKMVTTNSGTVATTDPMVRGDTKVPSKPIFLNVAGGTQYLALLLENGSPATCSVKQISIDGNSGSFTTLAASSTLTTTGPNTLGLYTSLQDAGVNNLVITSDVSVAGTATVTGAQTLTGATTIGTSVTLPSSTALVGLKFGTITLSSGTPSTGTATVLASMNCVCTNQTTQTSNIKCNVSSTTLTATGPNTVTDVVSYLCFK